MAKECRVKAGCVCGSILSVESSTAICEAAYMAWLEKHEVCVKMWQQANTPTEVQHQGINVPPRRGIGE